MHTRGLRRQNPISHRGVYHPLAFGYGRDMTPTQENLRDRARQSAERAAYAAVGAPTAALRALSARLRDIRETLETSREQMSSEMTREVEKWVEEGEGIVERGIGRIRRAGIADDVRSAARSATDAARTTYEKAARAASSSLDVIDPEEPLTTINGIGPGYADRLGRAGIMGISSLLDRTATAAGVEEVAKAAGVSEDNIIGWREQVDLSRIDGVGDSYQLLLHRAGVWTLEQLAYADVEDLVERIRSNETPDSPDQLPTETLAEQWRSQARAVVS